MHMRSRSQYTSNKRVLFCYEVVREIGKKMYHKGFANFNVNLIHISV